MCGRFALHASPELIAEFLSLEEIEAFPPRYNIAPTQPILIAISGRDSRPDANAANRSAQLARWGLIPPWVKDASKFPLLINARSETAATKNSFRAALKYRRCLIPATEFYEWRRSASGPSEPFLFRPKSGRPFAFAALMETAIDQDGGEIDTAAIITAAATGAARKIHDRMPVTIEEAHFERWLNCRDYAPGDVAGIFGASQVPEFDIVPISTAVNKVANAGPSIQEPTSVPQRQSERNDDGAGEAAGTGKGTGDQLTLL
ncbi:SOS response-associated peptidase [Fulvimarina sp. 2208YS6-2-32]|uniref:Abasic site processing protein n=1 Tax=Fulvimarina uroteuthidis TaxID=3098149 RepID=A0ABU5I506_9HYPH|nr:SOS response-associated peptidase [Fulvimarina sp. 2208YS6-2-32]MDY8110477.1 SOS response-associated peptidase [Fulvimarina sp. 2208YS6-2-32]